MGGTEEAYSQLRRSLGMRHMVVFGLSFMVPIAPFGIFGAIYAASQGQVVAAYVIGTGVMAVTALSFTTMAREFGGVGSVHTFVTRGVGPASGFLAGWMLLLDYLLVPSLICVLTANGLHAVIGVVPVWVFVVAIVIVTTACNMVGLAQTVRISMVLLMVQLVVLGLFVAVATARLMGGGANGAVLAPLLGTAASSPAALFAGVSVVVLSFLGFESIATLGEENAGRPATVGRAIQVSLGVCALLFVVQCWLAALLVPDPVGLLAGDPDGSAFYASVRVAGGPLLAAAAALAVVVAGLSNSLVAQASTARLVLSFARAGQAPAALAQVRGGQAPAAASLTVAALTLAVALTVAQAEGGLTTLVSLVNVGALTAFAALHVAAFVHLVVHGGSRRGHHMLVPPVGVLAIGVVVASSADVARTLGVVWLGLGITALAATVLVRRTRSRTRAAP